VRSLTDEVLGAKVLQNFICGDRANGAKSVWHDFLKLSACKTEKIAY
jgi:hypothetical protein